MTLVRLGSRTLDGNGLRLLQRSLVSGLPWSNGLLGPGTRWDIPLNRVYYVCITLRFLSGHPVRRKKNRGDTLGPKVKWFSSHFLLGVSLTIKRNTTSKTPCKERQDLTSRVTEEDR